jgi:hypothetical protein
MKRIPLTQGKFAVIDDVDYATVSPYKWYAVRNELKSGVVRFYAAARPYIKGEGRHPVVLMHRLVMNAPPDKQVDHRDGDGLHNARTNLRRCTRQNNGQNMRIAYGVSGLKGVSVSASGKWRASINSRYIGTFATKLQAATAYDQRAIEAFGEFAATNKSLGLIAKWEKGKPRRMTKKMKQKKVRVIPSNITYKSAEYMRELGRRRWKKTTKAARKAYASKIAKKSHRKNNPDANRDGYNGGRRPAE